MTYQNRPDPFIIGVPAKLHSFIYPNEKISSP
jgi:hypothetical protein